MTQDEGASSDGDTDYQNQTNQQDERDSEATNGNEIGNNASDSNSSDGQHNDHANNGTAADNPVDAEYMANDFQHEGEYRAMAPDQDDTDNANTTDETDGSPADGIEAPNADGTGIMDPDDPRIGEGDENGGVGAERGNQSQGASYNEANGQQPMQALNASTRN
ncbi:hypothetical protein [Bifidobacterium gallicum]|nr:hypothetical protein [Bifidobacterium gallicum]